MVGALSGQAVGAALMATTIPMIVGTGMTIRVVNAVFKRNGKPVGRTHYHFKGSKIVSHRHEGGHITHEHRGLRGYGKTRKTMKRWR